MPLLAWCVAIASAPAGDVTIRIVDGAKQPVAGAWIACGGTGYGTPTISLDALQRWIEVGGRGAPTTGVQWIKSGVDGSARVRECSFWNDFVAVTPTLGAHAIVPRGTAKDVALTLRPHRFWRVQVVDPADPEARPARTVRFGVERAPGSSRADVVLGEREPKGEGNVATFGPLDLALDPEEIEPVVIAKLELPWLVAPRLRRHAGAIGAAAMALPLPPHGAYEVQVVDGSGELVQRPVGVTFSTNEFSQLELPGPYFGGSRQTLRTHDGIVRIEPIGLGLSVRLGLEKPRPPGANGITSTLIDGGGVLEGLDHAGEVRVVTLVAPDGARSNGEVVVRGRVVDEQLGPLARHALEIVVLDCTNGDRLAGHADRGGFIESDDEALFVAQLELDEPLPEEAKLFVFDHGAIEADSRAQVAVGSSPIAKGAKWRGGEVGEITLTPLPILLSGQVVDAEGAPLPGLLVEVACDRDAFKADATIPGWWKQRYSHNGQPCDPAGRFEIRGFAGAQAWTVQSWQVGGGYPLSGRSPIVPGTRDVVLKRELGIDEPMSDEEGGIAGLLLLDPEVPRSVIKVELEPPGTKDDPTAHRWSLDGTFRDAPGDRFGFERVPIGKWDLRVRISALGEPDHELARLDGVEIHLGTTTPIPPIDLRGRIKAAHVRLVDRSGIPVPAGYVFCRERLRRPREPGAQPQPDYDRFWNAEYVACTTSDWPTLEFLGRGCRRLLQQLDKPGDFELVLPPPLVVCVRLPAALTLPPAPLTLDVSLLTDQILTCINFLHGGAPPDGDSASFDATGVVELRLPAAARYKLGIVVSHRTWSRDEHGSSSSWQGRDVQPDRSIDFADSDEPCVIDLDVTQQEIDKAVKQLGR